jgi:hypothetical protein
MFNLDNLLLILVSFLVLYVLIFLIYSIVRDPILWFLNFFHPKLIFQVRLSMAKRGHYRYEGLMIFAEKRGYPIARVLYSDNEESRTMAIGDAVDLQSRAGGVVIPA